MIVLTTQQLSDLVDEAQAFIVARTKDTTTLYACAFAVQTDADEDDNCAQTRFEGCGNVMDSPRFLRDAADAAARGEHGPMPTRN